ncbi:hypothetical protein [Planococcus alpniumensis]|uniref:hypothetical protein n=1 Tax=Planococcus alpniumensis TaxID=2708345 RepID=UPI001B8AF5AB|nr:hypothetical protein [Planococcus sp. MSAK28401]
MTILDLWKTSRSSFENKTIEQILSFSGTGKLTDSSETSIELKHFLDHMPIDYLERYAHDCLDQNFPNSGLVLQDITNQIGKRIGFDVKYGLYQGRKGSIGYDGLWKAIDSHSIVVEVKTTDAYRINLDTIAKYRKQLIAQESITSEKSSILIIVGRQDTGDLEAQIRGSKHAWDVRVISVYALIKLMKLKEQLNTRQTFNQINELLKPLEYTRVDNLIDIVFNASEDINSNDENTINKDSSEDNLTKENRASYHDLCIARLEEKYSTNFLKQGKSFYIDNTNSQHFVCIVSKEYPKKDSIRYWYAIHPRHIEFLNQSTASNIAFGCGSEKKIIIIPTEIFINHIDEFRITTKDNGNFYWHIDIIEKDKEYFLLLSNSKNQVNVTKYFY